MKVDVQIARVYGLDKRDGHYVLVDRLWPRGVSKADAPFDEWLKDVAPSTALTQVVWARPGAFRRVHPRLSSRARAGLGPGGS